MGKGDFGFASGPKADGTYDRIWFEEQMSLDEVSFDAGVFLLAKAKAKALKAGIKPEPGAVVAPSPQEVPGEIAKPEKREELTPSIQTRTLRLIGSIPPEIWN